jgi:hypothetical protein
VLGPLGHITQGYWKRQLYQVGCGFGVVTAVGVKIFLGQESKWIAAFEVDLVRRARRIRRRSEPRRNRAAGTPEAGVAGGLIRPSPMGNCHVNLALVGGLASGLF